MCCCGVERCLKWGALLVVVGVIFVGGVQLWMKEKSYVFSAESIAAISQQALSKTKGEGYNATFTLVEAELRKQYGSHILPPSQTEWIFVNAGGWMGAFYLLHASVTEYVLLFGTAVDTSGHSGRYWANISDTMVAGKFTQWKEGSTESVTYAQGDTIHHGVGEVAAIHWTANTWMVEYGRGFIPSTIGFALSDTIFSSQDFYIVYRTFRIYLIALVQEFLQGNL